MPFIPLSELVENFNDFHLVDIRSPAQFREGHLPHAQNISFPFRNEQLPALIGQWQKMRDLHPDQLIENFAVAFQRLEQLEKNSSRLLLYDDEGGIQAKLLDRILARNGKQRTFLSGGFRAFKDYQERFFYQNRTFYLLTGYTGCGKTEVLRALAALGAKVIDLEKLADHQGSVFGGSTKEEMPGPQDFNNRLWQSLLDLDPLETLFMEQKGDFIGNWPIPGGLLQQLNIAKRIHLVASLEDRVNRLGRAYAFLETRDLFCSLNKLKSKLSANRYEACREAIEDRNKDRFVRLLLDHYDQTKQYSFYATSPWLELDGEKKSPEDLAKKILEAVQLRKVLGSTPC